ncbi:MAG: sigma-70 family RNA polymerase sigma factor [Bacilli bacterium]|nr:sigma-70 family RNA polymerase sigma factor [Bacilli bacterium]
MKELLEEYDSREKVEAALAKANEGKREDEKLYYCRYKHSLTGKWMYVPCSKKQFEDWRSMQRDEAKRIDLETRCVVPSKRYGWKKCMENCDSCPYGKLKREGNAISLDYTYENEDGDEFEFEIEDTSPSVVEKMEKQELLDELKRLLDELDDDDRQIIELFKLNMSDAEIAKALHSKKSTIQYRRSRIIETLKIKLEKFF